MEQQRNSSYTQEIDQDWDLNQLKVVTNPMEIKKGIEHQLN